MRAGFESLPAIEGSVDFERRILRSVARERKLGAGRVLPFPSWVRPAALAAAAGLLVVVATWALLNRSSEPGVENRIAQRVDEGTREIEASIAGDPGTPVHEVGEVARLDPATFSGPPTAPPGGARARAALDPELERLLGAEGTPLLPPGSEAHFVLDDAGKLSGLLSGGADGVLTSAPITF